MKITSVKKPTLSQIKAEVIAAYNEETRNLHFKASGPMGIDAAVKTMTKALDIPNEDCEGYNNFKPSFLRFLPKGTKITLAREGSVCVYITPPKPFAIQQAKLIRAMMIDEWDQCEGTFRLWWD